MNLHRADYYGLVDQAAKDIGISDTSAKLAKEFLKDARRFRLTSGFRPSALAAAALYFACIFRWQRPEMVTQSRLAKSSGVSEAAVRRNYKRLLRRLTARLPKIADHYSQWRPVESYLWRKKRREEWESEFFGEVIEDSRGKEASV